MRRTPPRTHRMPVALASAFLTIALLGVALTGCPSPASGPSPQSVEVPDVVGLVQAVAEAQLTAVGLAVGTVSKVHSDTVARDAVIAQQPTAGTTVATGTTVNLVVSLGPDDEPWEEDSFVFEVSLAPDAVLVEEQDLDLLLDADTENHVYLLDAGAMAARGIALEVGDVLILDGIAVRRVTALSEDAGRLAVSTGFVPLNEVITDGTIAWDFGVEFTPAMIQAIEVGGQQIAVPQDGAPIVIELEIGGFKYRLEATLDTTFSTVAFTITKGVGPDTTVRLIASGTIERFRSRDTITFADGELLAFDHRLDGMRGDVTLELVAAASGTDSVNLEFPTVILRVPLRVSWVPVVLNVKAQFVINAVVPPTDGSARVSTRFTYDSDLGLAYDGTQVMAGGRLGGIAFGDAEHHTGASSPIAATFGVGFPRVELNIFGNAVVPWAQTAFLVGGSYTLFPPCQTADALFLGAAGYNLSFLGLPVLSGSRTLFSVEEPLLRAGDCPD